MFFLDEWYYKWDAMEEILPVNGGAAPPIQPSGWLNW